MSARSANFRPGDVIPGTKYTIVKELGAGGMGVVYQVVKPPQIQGVLKLMSVELAGMEDLRTRFFDEVRILAQLEHPNIVRVFDYDALPDGTPYYVMELLNGRTLRDALATMGRLPPRVAFEITRQLLEALHCAHTHDVPVVHRDIKPENIFLHAPRHGDPVLKLIDFGVIAVADRKHDGLFVGTWRYAAPEQIRGERATPATDLYAVGLVLYEMLAGRGPFDHLDSGTLVSQAHLNDPADPISKYAPWVPPSVVELLASALSKDPRGRPRDAYVFAERLYELEAAKDGEAANEPTKEGPIGRVLSTLSAARPSGPTPAAPALRAPEADTAAPPPSTGETTTPDEDDLLEGLAARPDERVPSRRDRPRGAIDSDTFASQQSDARPARARAGFLWIPIAIAAVGVAGALAIVVAKTTSGAKPPDASVSAPVTASPPTTTPPATTTTAPSAAPSAAPEPPSASASAAPPPAVVVRPSAPARRAPTSAPSKRVAAPPPAATTPPKRTDDLMRGL